MKPFDILSLERYDSFRRALMKNYNEDNRHYHNLHHIMKMFYYADKMGFLLSIPQILAIWFHDIVYVPGARNNEENSAALLEAINYDQCMRYGGTLAFMSEHIHTATEIILNTARHTEDIPDLPRDHQKILDLDLSDFSSDSFHYNDSLIRREMAHLPAGEVVIGRIQFLKKLLARQQLYYTPEFQSRIPFAIANIKSNLFQLRIEAKSLASAALQEDDEKGYDRYAQAAVDVKTILNQTP